MVMKILVLLDGSMWSQKAAMHALKIAKEKEAEVTLFSVLDLQEVRAMAFNFCTQSNMCDLIKNHEKQIWRDMKQNINDEIANMLYLFNSVDLKCTSIVAEGDTKEEIVNEANTGGYSLVVMGAYGKNSKSRVGNLFAEISREIAIPVFISR